MVTNGQSPPFLSTFILLTFVLRSIDAECLIIDLDNAAEYPANKSQQGEIQSRTVSQMGCQHSHGNLHIFI